MFLRVFHTVLLIAVLVPAALAQAPKLTASGPAQVAVGENFRLTWELNTGGSDFTAPEITDFQVLGGPNQSTSMQYINGSMSQSVSFSYILRAKSEGTFEIGPARIKADGKVVQSNSLTVKVVAGSAHAGGQQQQQRSSNQQQQQQPAQDIGENLFARIEVNKRNVSQGEMLTAQVKFYSRVNIVNIGELKLPSFEGFWNKPLDQGNQVQMGQEVVDGVQYQVGTIRNYVLYPQKSGKIEIGPMEMVAIVRERTQGRSRSFWDPFGMSYQDYEVPLKSKPVTINVEPLPSGRPADFSGLTGRFKLTANLDRKETVSNEAVNLSVTISGDGNLYQVQAPKIDFPPDIEAYDPKVTDNIKVSANGVSGSRTFEYVLIPRYAGEFEIGPFAFSYFDPSSNSYKTSEQEAFMLKVEKGAGEEDHGPRSVTIAGKEDIRMIGSDIRYIKQGQYPMHGQGEHFFRSGLFYGLLAAPALLFAIVLGYAGYMEKAGADVAGMKSRGATKLAKKRLAVAKKLMAENNATAFYEEVFKALTEYVAFRHRIPVSELTKDRIRDTLMTKKVAQPSIDGFIAVLDKAEFARFAPGADKQMGTMYEDALSAIVSVEEAKSA